MSISIHRAGLYLSRTGRQVGIIKDRGPDQRWRFLTTRGHYVTADGRAAIVGESVEDLTVDVTPQVRHLDGADSMFGGG